MVPRGRPKVKNFYRRRREDSNLRSAFALTAFREQRIRPLCHVSVSSLYALPHKKTAPPGCFCPSTQNTWHRPTLARVSLLATIGAGGLNFRGRNGNGCTPVAKGTKKPALKGTCDYTSLAKHGLTYTVKIHTTGPISTGRLNTLLCVHLPPINLIIFEGSPNET